MVNESLSHSGVATVATAQELPKYETVYLTTFNPPYQKTLMKSENVLLPPYS